MSVLFRMASRNVRKNWRHSLAAILTISAGLISHVLFSGYMGKIDNVYREAYRYREMFGDMIIENQALASPGSRSDPFKFYLTPEEQTLITRSLEQQKEKIAYQVRFLTLWGLGSTNQSSGIVWGFGYDTEAGAAMRGPSWNWNVTYGNPLHLSQNPYPILLGQTLAKNFGCTTEKTYKFNAIEGYAAENRPFTCRRPEVQISLLTETGSLNALDFEVVGLVDAGYRDLDVRYIHTTLSAAQTLLNTQKISYLTVQLTDPSLTSSFIANFNAAMAKTAPHLKAFTWAEHPVGEIYLKTMELLKVFKVFVVTVIISISFLSTFNTMVKIVKERIREIGTLRSLGFLRTQILRLFALEAFLLACLGCGAGSVIALVISSLLNILRIPYKAGMMSEPTLFLIQYQPLDYLQAFAFLAALTVATAIFACREPTQKSVAENMAYV